MSWFKKKTNGQNAEIQIPLVDQPLQMPEKTNEELLAELSRIVKMRSKIGNIVVLAPLLGFILVKRYMDDLLHSHQYWRFIDWMADVSERIGKGWVDLFFWVACAAIFSVVFFSAPILNFSFAYLKSRRTIAIVSELIRRREAKVLITAEKLVKNNSSWFNPAAASCFQAFAELLPYAGKSEYVGFGRLGHRYVVGLLNHPNEAIRANAKDSVIEYGTQELLDFMNSYHIDISYCKPKKWNLMSGVVRLQALFCHQQVRAFNPTVFNEYCENLKECIEALRVRLKIEIKDENLLRPSSALSDGSELLRAAAPGVSQDAFDTLLRPDNRPLEEKSVVEIAANYLPSPSQNSNEISENRTRN